MKGGKATALNYSVVLKSIFSLKFILYFWEKLLEMLQNIQ